MPRWLRWSLGSLLMLAGIAGLLVPIMPGWLFIIPAMVLIFGDDTSIGRWLLLKLHCIRRWQKRTIANFKTRHLSAERTKKAHD